MAITKNKQSRETILKMAGAAFPERKVAEIRGMCPASLTGKGQCGEKLLWMTGFGIITEEPLF